jgi:hypothetical protein
MVPSLKNINQITRVPNYISGSKIIAMALNVSETVLIALTDTLQLMSFALKSNKGKVSFLGVDALWIYCMVFPADQKSQFSQNFRL